MEDPLENTPLVSLPGKITAEAGIIRCLSAEMLLAGKAWSLPGIPSQTTWPSLNLCRLEGRAPSQCCGAQCMNNRSRERSVNRAGDGYVWPVFLVCAVLLIQIYLN